MDSALYDNFRHVFYVGMAHGILCGFLAGFIAAILLLWYLETRRRT